MARRQQDSEISRRIGAYIRKRREILGITQTELGRRVGYSYGNFVAILERGSGKFPFDKWQDYAEALQIPEEDHHRFLKMVIEDQHPHLLPYIVFRPYNERRMSTNVPPIDGEDAPVTEYEEE